MLEAFPSDVELVETTGDFNTLIREAMSRIPEKEIRVDPYKPSFAGVERIEFPSDYIIDAIGRLSFGRGWAERRVHTTNHNHELIFAENPSKGRVEFYIDNFQPHGGLKARTQFFISDHGPTKKVDIGGKGEQGTFSRKLKRNERRQLVRTIRSLGADSEAVENLVRFKKADYRLLRIDRAHHEKILAEFNARLQAIDEAERNAWDEADKTILY